MKSKASDRLALRYKTFVVLAAVAATTVVIVLAVTNVQGRDPRPSRLRDVFCQTELTQAELSQIDSLSETGTYGAEKPFPQRLAALAPNGAAEVFFETRSAVWSVSTHAGLRPATEASFPPGYGGWELLRNERCGAFTEQRYIGVVKSVATPQGRRAVLVLRVVRDPNAME